MRTQPIEGELSPAGEDIRAHRTVLTHILALHPTHQTIPELVREITAGFDDFAGSDAVERAVRDLTGIGLLNCPGGIVMPTRAAIHFDSLSDV